MTIPIELRERSQWVNWKLGPPGPTGKRKKLPIDPTTGSYAKSTDPTTWGTYSEVIARDKEHVGYVFTREDGFAGVDFDHCMQNGVLTPWVKNAVEALDSYTEISPSGEGLHVLVRSPDCFDGSHRKDVGIFTHDRYFTMTGNHLDGTPEVIQPRQKLLRQLHDKAKIAESSTPPGMRELLMAGDWTGAGCPSPSEADFTLIQMLRKSTGQDRLQAESLFRESVLYRTRLAERGLQEAERKLKTDFDKAFKGVLIKREGRILDMEIIRETYGDLKWAWENWIPTGHVTMVAGAQGVGKSYFAAVLLASAAGYRNWPDGQSPSTPGIVFLSETEGMRGEYARRLKALGAGDRVMFGPMYDPFEQEFIDDENFIPDVRRFTEEMNSRMLVIDSLSGGHSRDENDSKMRSLLQICTSLASGLQIPVVLVHHVRKRGPQESDRTTIDRVRGSSTITQFCRSVIAIWRVGSEETVRIEVIKSNFVKTPDALGMQIVGGQPIFVDPPQEVRPGSPAMQEGEDFLREILRDGPVEIQIVKDKAEELGITNSTLKRLRRREVIETVRELNRQCYALKEDFHLTFTGGGTDESLQS